jgi:hypothetical protein
MFKFLPASKVMSDMLCGKCRRYCFGTSQGCLHKLYEKKGFAEMYGLAGQISKTWVKKKKQRIK